MIKQIDAIMRDEEGRFVCPRSWDACAGQPGEKFKFHFATETELLRNGGVCAECRKIIQQSHGAALRASGEESAEGSRAASNVDMGCAGFAEDGHIEPTVDFDWNQIDSQISSMESDACHQAAELLAIIFRWCWTGKPRLSTATIRFSAIVAGLRPDLLENRTYEQIAQELGVTKAAVSRAALKFQDKWAFKFGRSYSSQVRANCARATRENWRRGALRREKGPKS